MRKKWKSSFWFRFSGKSDNSPLFLFPFRVTTRKSRTSARKVRVQLSNAIRTGTCKRKQKKIWKFKRPDRGDRPTVKICKTPVAEIEKPRVPKTGAGKIRKKAKKKPGNFEKVGLCRSQSNWAVWSNLAGIWPFSVNSNFLERIAVTISGISKTMWCRL